MRLLPALLLVALLGPLGVSCRSKPKPPSGDLLTNVVIGAPLKGEWRRMNRTNKRLFFNTNNAVTDEDLVIITVEAIQLPRLVNDVQDLIPLLGLDKSPDIEDVSVEDLVGTPVVRWHLHKLDDIGTPESFLSHLDIGRRESREQYFRRSKGIVMLHPDPTKPGCIVRIGVSRTSIHGYIGTYYEEIAVDYMSRFIANNDGRVETPGEGLTP